MTAAGLEADTALERVGELRWRADISKRWWIIQGPYGGYISALLVRALIEAVGDTARQPRSFTVHFLAAPKEGPAEIAATIERAGRSATFASLRMEQDGVPVALALASATVWREDEPGWDDATMPDVPGPDDLPDLVRPPEMPEFTARYDIRWVAGGGIGRPGRRARNLAWARPRPAAPLDAVTVASLADTLVPAAFSRLGRFAIVPTMDLTIHFRAPLPAEGEWLLCSFSSLLADGGVWEEDGEVWSQDGRLLAQSRQLAIIREPR